MTWVIDIDAGGPEEAAQEALRIQRKPDSIATVFEVQDRGDPKAEPTVVDLGPEQ